MRVRLGVPVGLNEKLRVAEAVRESVGLPLHVLVLVGVYVPVGVGLEVEEKEVVWRQLVVAVALDEAAERDRVGDEADADVLADLEVDSERVEVLVGRPVTDGVGLWL